MTQSEKRDRIRGISNKTLNKLKHPDPTGAIKKLKASLDRNQSN